ncbi:MAG: MBG domain-containing protein [Prevotellaceae bacterium]|nr:MBG domain-containing protein [Prevotellaceae bacterium]
MRKIYQTLLLLCLALAAFEAGAQTKANAITTTEPYTQNFDGIGTTAVATLPDGWRMEKLPGTDPTPAPSANYETTAATQTEYHGGNDMTNFATNGLYNFGAGDPALALDRAIGGLSVDESGKTQSVNIYLKLENTGNAAIESLSIEYSVEKYRKGNNANGFRIQLYYSADGVDWTSAGDNFKTVFGADDGLDGYASAPGKTGLVKATLNQRIEADGSIYLAWNYSMNASSGTAHGAQALGIDDVSISAVATPPPASEFCLTKIIPPKGNDCSGDDRSAAIFSWHTEPDGKVRVTIAGLEGNTTTSFRGVAGMAATNLKVTGKPGVTFTGAFTDAAQTAIIFTPSEALVENDVLTYSATVEYKTAEAPEGGFALQNLWPTLSFTHTFGKTCLPPGVSQLSTPTNVAVDGDGKLTFIGDDHATSHELVVYRGSSALPVHVQEVSSGATIGFDRPGTYTLTVQSLSTSSDYLNSGASARCNWFVDGNVSSVDPGETVFCNFLYNGGNDDEKALFTWETIDGNIIIRIAPVDESYAPTAFRNDGTTEAFTVNGWSGSWFTRTINTGKTEITLTPKSGVELLPGDIIGYNGMVEYLTGKKGSLYPTINFTGLGPYIYGSRCPQAAMLETPVVTDVDGNGVITFASIEHAERYALKVYRGSTELVDYSVGDIASNSSIDFGTPGEYTVTVQAIGDQVLYLNSEQSARFSWTLENEDYTPPTVGASLFCGFALDPAPADYGDNDRAVFSWETRDGNIIVKITPDEGNFDTYFRNNGMSLAALKVNGQGNAEWFTVATDNEKTEVIFTPKIPLRAGDKITYNGIVEYRTGKAINDLDAPLGLWPDINFGAYGDYLYGSDCDYAPAVVTDKKALTFSPDAGVRTFTLSAVNLTAPLAVVAPQGLSVHPSIIYPLGNGSVPATPVEVRWEEGSSAGGVVSITGGGLAFAKEITVNAIGFSEYCNKVLSFWGESGYFPTYLSVSQVDDNKLSFALSPLYGDAATWNANSIPEDKVSVSRAGVTLSDRTYSGNEITLTFSAPLQEGDVVSIGPNPTFVWTAQNEGGATYNNCYIDPMQTYTVGASCALIVSHPAVYPAVASAEALDRANTSATLKIAANEDAATYAIHAVRLREANGLLSLQERELAADSLYALDELEPATAYSFEIWAVDEKGYSSASYSSLSFTTRDVLVVDSFEYALPDGDITYDGAERPVAVTHKAGVAAGIGAVVVKYNASEDVPVNAGSYAVTLEVAQGEDFMAETFVLGSFSIVEAPVLADLLDYDTTAVTYDGALHPVAVAAKSAVIGLGTTITVKYNDKENVPVDVPVDAGEYLVTVDIDAGSNYLAAADLRLGTLLIDKAAIISADSFSVAPVSATYSGAPQPVKVNVNAGVRGLGAISVLYNDSGDEPVDAGKYGVTLSLSEGSNYLAGTVELPDSFEVSKAVLTADHLSYTPKSIQYDGDPHEVGVTPIAPYTGLGVVTVKYNGSTTAPSAENTYTVTVSVAEGDNFSATIEDIELGDFVISTKLLVTSNELDYAVADVTYDGNPHTIAVTATQGVTLGEISVLYNDNAAAPVSAGRYVIKVGVAESNDYALTELELPDTLTILKAPVLADLLAYDTTAIEYDEAPHPVAVTAKENLIGLGTTITVKYNGSEAVPVNAGEYVVTVDVAEGINYLAAADLRLGTLIITEVVIDKLPVTLAELEYAVADATYDGNPHTIAVTAKQDVELGEISVLYNNNAAAPVSAGRYVIKVEVEENDDYALTALELPDTLTILKAPVLADLLDYDTTAVAYDEAPHPVAVTAKENLIGLGTTITVKYNGSDAVPINAGEYVVTVDVAEGVNYLAAADLRLGTLIITEVATGKLPVTLAELDYAVTDATYDGNPHTIAVTAKQNVELGEISVLYNENTAAPVNAGKYVITVEVAESDDYALTELELPDTLTILKAPVLADLLAYDTTAVEYDGATHAVVVIAKESVIGLGTTITVKYNGSDAEPVNAGEYVVTVDVAEGVNYLAAANLRLGTLIITEVVIGKLPVTLAELEYAISDSIVYDKAPHSVTVAAKSTVIGLGAITVKYNGSTAAPVEVGVYAVTVDVAEGENYLAATNLALGQFVIYAAPVVDPPTAVEHSSASTLSAYVADGILHVSGEVESVRMVNTSGAVALSARIAAGQTLSVAHLPAGIYFVALQGKSASRVVTLHVVN